MSFSPIPDYSFQQLDDVTPEFLRGIGVTLLLCDLDNTIVPYKSTGMPTKEMTAWVSAMRCGGVDLFVVSNTHSDRARTFAAAMDIPYVHKARKPTLKGMKIAMKQTGKAPEEAALVGDQIYTDVIVANRMGVCSILVEPIKLGNIFLTLRYLMEIPFRSIGRRKMRKDL